jgi:hypothetical protein
MVAPRLGVAMRAPVVSEGLVVSEGVDAFPHFIR